MAVSPFPEGPWGLERIPAWATGWTPRWNELVLRGGEEMTTASLDEHIQTSEIRQMEK